MEYREFCPEDYQYLKRLLNELQDFFVEMEDEYRSFSEDDAQEYLDKIINDAKEMNGKIYLALKDGEAVGFIQGVIIDKNDLQYHPCKEGWIGLLFVEKNLRGGSIGKSLMDKMCEYFRSKECDYIKLFCSNQNANAVDFYKKYGFEISNLELKLN